MFALNVVFLFFVSLVTLGQAAPVVTGTGQGMHGPPFCHFKWFNAYWVCVTSCYSYLLYPRTGSLWSSEHRIRLYRRRIHSGVYRIPVST